MAAVRLGWREPGLGGNGARWGAGIGNAPDQ